MSKLVWDAVGERFYETGLDRGVLFVGDGAGGYETGVAWNGLTSVSENPSGGEANAVYADNIKYLNLTSETEFGATVEALTYPPEFAECDGSAAIAPGVIIEGQRRKNFALCYRTKVGNDEDEDYGYKIHIIYGAKASPSEKSRQTINDSPETVTFSWELTTTPVKVTVLDPNGKPYKPVAHLVIDSTLFTTTALKEKLAALEEILYGRDADSEHSITALEPTLKTPDEIYTLMTSNG